MIFIKTELLIIDFVFLVALYYPRNLLKNILKQRNLNLNEKIHKAKY